MLGNKTKIAELSKQINDCPNIVCFCAKPKEGDSTILIGGNAIIGDMDIVGNYIVSTLISDPKLYDFLKQIMKIVEDAKQQNPKLG